MREIPLRAETLAAFESGDRPALLADPHPVLLAFARGDPEDIRFILDAHVVTGNESLDDRQAFWRKVWPPDGALMFAGCGRYSPGARTDHLNEIVAITRQADAETFWQWMSNLDEDDPERYIRLASGGRHVSDEERRAAIREGLHRFPHDHRFSALDVHNRCWEIWEARRRNSKFHVERRDAGDEEAFERGWKALRRVDRLDYNHFMWLDAVALSAARPMAFLHLCRTQARHRRAARRELVQLLG